MALTNYNMLICKGKTVTDQEVGEMMIFDVTQGTVLDALKAGAIVVLVTVDESVVGTVDTFFSIVTEFSISANSKYCVVDDLQIGLNNPDVPLNYAVQ